jgi:succinate dehydrogenase/fumarate reductase cytochrome b subunit
MAWRTIAFIGFEFTARAMDFFVVGQSWANAFHASGSSVEKAMIVHRYVLWSDMVRGIYFELMLSFLLASCAFFYATLQDQDRWSRLASLAFALNALRLLGRISSTFAGQRWLDALNDSAYFPIVFVINCMLAAWFFHLANGVRHIQPGRSGNRCQST